MYYIFVALLSIFLITNIYNEDLIKINYFISLIVLSIVISIYGFLAYKWFFTTPELNMYGTFPIAFFSMADFSSNIHTSMCPPLIAQFTDLSISNISTDYYWDFGDFSSSYQKAPSHVYSDSGNFSVRLIVVDDLGCSDTLIRNDMIIIENSNPSGNFSVSDDNNEELVLQYPLRLQFGFEY